MSDFYGVQPSITKIIARQATQAHATIPKGTKAFQMAAYNSTATIKFSFKSGTVSTALTNFLVPPKTIYKQDSVYLSTTLIYLSVTNIATCPIGLICWQ